MWPQGKPLDVGGVRRKNRELADYLEDIAEQPLDFRDAHPNGHSKCNHRHLWLLEYAADRDTAIDLPFRVAAVTYILNRWRDRLPGFEPYQRDGFRIYLYEDMAPTVSIVAETKDGFPYQGCADFTFVDDIARVLRPYLDMPWKYRFKASGPKPETLFKELKRAEGSLTNAAKALGMPLAVLRRTIETYGIAKDVNKIRKHHNRRPAQFDDSDWRLSHTLIWEHRLPARFTKTD